LCIMGYGDTRANKSRVCTRIINSGLEEVKNMKCHYMENRVEVAVETEVGF